MRKFPKILTQEKFQNKKNDHMTLVIKCDIQTDVTGVKQVGNIIIFKTVYRSAEQFRYYRV